MIIATQNVVEHYRKNNRMVCYTHESILGMKDSYYAYKRIHS